MHISLVLFPTRDHAHRMQANTIMTRARLAPSSSEEASVSGSSLVCAPAQAVTHNSLDMEAMPSQVTILLRVFLEKV